MSIAEEYRDDDLTDQDGENFSDTPSEESEESEDSFQDSADFAEPDLESASESDEVMEKDFAGDFSILRLIFTTESFSLQKGVLEGQQLEFSEIHSFNLPFTLTAATWKSPDAVEKLIGIVQLECAAYFPPEMRLSINLPSDWGVTRNIDIPGDVPEDTKTDHISWSLKISIWEDDEPARFNYFRSNDETYTVACIRESLVKFGESLAESLGSKLMQISLSEYPDLNLLLPPQEESLDEDFIVGERKSKAAFVIPVIFILVIAAGYYFVGVKKVHQRFFAASEPAVQDTIPAVEEPVSEVTETQVPGAASTQPVVESKPVDTVKRTQTAPAAGQQMPFTSLFTVFHNNTDIYHLSFTGETVRGKISSSAANKADIVANKLSSSGIVRNPKKQYSGVEDGKYMAILTASIHDRHLNGYTHPDGSTVKNLLNKSGFKTDPRNRKYDNFNGSSRTITSILKLIDSNNILLYRIRISQVTPDNYVLTLEY